MDIFGRPNIEKMVVEGNREGLYECLDHRDSLIRLQAAQALAQLGDGAGWRVLSNWVLDSSDRDLQEGAAALLSELGSRSPGDSHRAIPVLGQALKDAHGETAEFLRDALLAIGGQEAETALRDAGFTPSIEETTGEVDDYEAHFVRPVIPDTHEIHFPGAETHLNNAVQLREAELAERGLVEGSLALWYQPKWAYALYLRGVLFEDLDRQFEAWLAYRQAVEIDLHQEDAEQAIIDLEQGEYHLLEMNYDELARAATSPNWRDRRDAAAGFVYFPERTKAQNQEIFDMLTQLIQDDEREVRSAAVNATGLLGDSRGIALLLDMSESSWLLRFSIIEAVARLRNVDTLVSVLEREMQQLTERNPSFSSQKDPLVEVEYELLMEVGVLALQSTGDIESLLTLAEGNAWEVIEEDDVEYVEQAGGSDNEWVSEDDEELDVDEEADEDLSAYVDEVSEMVCLALERAARPKLASLDKDLLLRLSEVPDLTLIDLENPLVDDNEEPPTATVCDLTNLRQAAKAELARR